MNREVTIILGKTGYGKSWWSKLYIQKFSRRFVYDPAMSAEYQVLYENGAEIVADMTEQGEHFLNPENSFSRGIIDHNEVDMIGCLAFYFANNIMLIEEVSNVFQKGLRELPQWAKRIIFYGRHKAVSIALIAQRASSIPIDFRSQATRIISFQQHEYDDVSWLERFFGKEHCRSMPTLQKFTCLDYDNGQIGQYSIIDRVQSTFGVKLDIGNDAMVECP